MEGAVWSVFSWAWEFYKALGQEVNKKYWTPLRASSILSRMDRSLK